MARAFFVVRAVVADAALRPGFDRWYATDHLPWAARVFGAEKAWRLWSRTDTAVHYAVYQFSDLERLETALKSDGFKDLVADFDRVWPAGVSRSREIVELAEESVA